MSQYIITAVRTGVQALVGLLVAWLLTAGITIDQDALLLVVDGLVIGAVTLLLRWLEARLPWLTPWLSLGTTKTGPTYNH